MASIVWKGYLSFGLVSFPVRLFSAARTEAVHFHMLHQKDLSRVREVWYCAEEDKPIERSEIIKGFEVRKGEYITVDDDELKKIDTAARRCPLIARLFFSLQSAPGFLWSESGVHRNRRLLVGEENPVAILPGKFAPRSIDIITKGDQYVALVLPASRRRPCSDGPLPNGQRWVRNHGLFRCIIRAANPVTARTRALRAICRKCFPVEFRLTRRICAGS
jgi:hypothetical protein